MAIPELYSWEPEPEGPGFLDILGNLAGVAGTIAGTAVGGPAGAAIAAGSMGAGTLMQGGSVGDAALAAGAAGAEQGVRQWAGSHAAKKALERDNELWEKRMKNIKTLMFGPPENISSTGGAAVPGRTLNVDPSVFANIAGLAPSPQPAPMPVSTPGLTGPNFNMSGGAGGSYSGYPTGYWR